MMGPLAGHTVIELAGIGPAPLCGMMLADMGAEVILVERKTANPNAASATDSAAMGKCAIFNRGKKSITLDLKDPKAVQAVLELVERSDALIEGFRPGVVEKLGLGPDVCLQRNPALVFGRVTGWGQTGPLAKVAGHDINYIALSGALYYSGRHDAPPLAPPTLVGDAGGGGMMLALGILAGIINARQTGKGQVVDAAITDGSAILSTLLFSFHQYGVWSNERSANMIDGGSAWYNTYECADGEFISVASLEPNFYSLLLDKCGLNGDSDFSNQFQECDWPRAKEKLSVMFKQKTRAEWCDLLEGTDVCFAPVLNFEEASKHPHNLARGTFLDTDGVLQPAPAPRFSETPSNIGASPPSPGANTDELLRELGYEDHEISELQ